MRRARGTGACLSAPGSLGSAPHTTPNEDPFCPFSAPHYSPPHQALALLARAGLALGSLALGSCWTGQRPPVNRGNRGNADVCGEKIRWSSKKFQPLMSRFPSGAVEFSPHLAEFSPFLAEFSPCLAEFSPFLAEMFPCVAEFSPYLAECLPFWRNVARSGGFFAWSGGVFAFYLAWWASD